MNNGSKCAYDSLATSALDGMVLIKKKSKELTTKFNHHKQ